MPRPIEYGVFLPVSDGGFIFSQRNKAKAKELGTATRTIGLVMVVPGRTDAEAEERVKRFNDGADVEALATRAWQYSQSAREWSHDEQVRLFIADLRTFGEEVLPRLVERGMGLRGTERPSLLAPGGA